MTFAHRGLVGLSASKQQYSAADERALLPLRLNFSSSVRALGYVRTKATPHVVASSPTSKCLALVQDCWSRSHGSEPNEASVRSSIGCQKLPPIRLRSIALPILNLLTYGTG